MKPVDMSNEDKQALINAKAEPECAGYYGEVNCTTFESGHSRLWLSGQVLSGDEPLSAAQLHDSLSQVSSSEALTQFCLSLRGFFSLVWQTGSEWLLITDRVRSRPLFWTDKLPITGCRVSHSAFALSDQSDSRLDDVSAEEFLHTGFVTGRSTLIAGVFQVQAGEWIKLDTKGDVLATERYFWFLPQNNSTFRLSDTDIQHYKNQLDLQMRAAVERLVRYAAGRQIVLPLSGGYDSRILAVYLKQSGYKNLSCFSFGNKNSKELSIAKDLASALQLPWQQVIYTKAMWKKLACNNEFEKFLHTMHGAVSVPAIQVFPALKQLLTSGYIKKDAVLVPGHTGDFVSGGHLPSADITGIAALLRSIKLRHYSLSAEPLSSELVKKLQNLLMPMVRQAEERGLPLCSVAECWNWQERQAKFIVNSNRYYDFFKLDWWMPLWDPDFVEVWLVLPLVVRRDKALWIKFVDEQTRLVAGKAIAGNADDIKLSWLKKAINFFNYFTDSNSMYALMPFKRWLLYRCKLSKKTPFLFSLLAEKRIEWWRQYLSRGREK